MTKTIDDIVKIKKDDLVRIILGVNELTKVDVLIGVPQERDARDDGSDFGNASIAFVQEFGSPVNNIPPRPHIVPGIEKALPRAVEDGIKMAGLAALKGDLKKIDAYFHIAGQTCADSIRDVIRRGVPPPLAKRTLDARKARGKFSTTPLIDTGNYYRSITYVLRRK